MAGGSPPRRFTASNFQLTAKGAGRPASRAVRGASRLKDVGLKEPITHRAGNTSEIFTVPESDSITSALVMENLERCMGNSNAKAVRTGNVNK